jgi:hypothetical protein
MLQMQSASHQLDCYCPFWLPCSPAIDNVFGSLGGCLLPLLLPLEIFEIAVAVHVSGRADGLDGSEAHQQQHLPKEVTDRSAAWPGPIG